MSDNVNIIVQDTINDIVVNTAVVVETIDINVQVAVDEVNIIANPNNYVVNINRIIGEQVQSDWDQNDDQEPDYIKNKPTIPTLTSDLTNDGEDGINPFITANDLTPQVNSDWNATSGVEEILNKPTIPAAQVNSDWNATSGVEEILNKPSIPTLTSDLINDGEDGVNPFITAADLPTFATADRMVTVGRNSTGSTLYRGTIVYILGSTGNRPNFVKSIASSEGTSAGTFGVIENDIPNNSDGNCVTIGTIENLDTRSNATHPFTTNTLVDGDTIYLSPTNAGFITNVKPSAPDHLVYIGKVVRTSPTNGTIVYRIQNGYELQELHNVAINSVSNNQLLAYESSTSLWKNKSVTTAEIADSLNKRYVTDANLTTIGNQSGVNTGDQDLSGLTPNTRTISTTTPLQGGGDLSANRTLSILQSNTSQSGFLSNTDWNTFNNKFNLPSLTSGSVLFSNGTTIAQDNANLFWDDTNNRLGIGTASPSHPLNIYTTIADVGILLDSNTNPAFIIKRAGVERLKLSATGTIGTVNGLGNGLVFQTDSVEKMRISSAGNVGIGETVPTAKLHIKAPGALSTDIALRVRNSADTADLFQVQGNGAIVLSSGAAFYTLGNNLNFRSFLAGGSGWVLDVQSYNSLNSTSNEQGFGFFSGTYAPTSGTGTLNGLKITPTINQTGGANGITRGLFINPTLTAAADFRAIETTIGNVILGSTSGNVGIGTTAPTTKLHITGITQIVESGNTAFYGGNYVRVFNDPNFNIRNSGGTTIANISVNGASYFNGGNVGIGTATPTEKLDINGAIQIRGTRVNNSGEGGFMDYSAGRFRLVSQGQTNTTAGEFLFTVRELDLGGSVDALYIGNTGNVGIGTTSPTAKLHIKAPGALSTDIALRVRNSADTLDLVTVDGLGTLIGKGFQGTYFYAGTTYYDNARIYIGSTSNAKFQTFTSGFSIEQGALTTIAPTAIFELKSTTQGFLPPRMTNAQRIAIATPAVGLCVYCTDVVEGLYINKSTGWTYIG